jgi:predicted nucleic acid-binding protein
LIAYADTGFLVSLYGQDHQSAEARILARLGPIFILTPFGEAEFSNAVKLQVFRKLWTRPQAEAVYANLLHHQSTATIRSLPFPAEAWERALKLTRRHSGKLGTRALDVLHVASALVLKPDVFLTFDKRQSKLAKAEGLQVLPR